MGRSVTNSKLQIRRSISCALIAGCFALFTTKVSAEGDVLPGIEITNPPSGAAFTYPCVIRLITSISGTGNGNATVRFYDRTNFLGLLSAPPYNWTLTNFAAALHSFTATVTDQHGISSTSAPITVSVWQDVIAPFVFIQQPTEGQALLLSDPVQVTVMVHNFDGSENPLVLLAGTNQIGVASAPLYSAPVTNSPSFEGPFVAYYYNIVVTNPPIGSQPLTARYRDNLGNWGDSPGVRVTFSPLVLTGAALKDGNIHFTVQGLTEAAMFQIQVSPNLLSWLPVSTNTSSSNVFDFSEPIGTQQEQFYRVFQSPP